MKISWNILVCLMLWSSAVFANEKVIKGVVVDAQQYALAYVNIGIPGTSLGTVSGEDGTFELYLPETIAGQDSLIFSMVGYESKGFQLETLLAACAEEVVNVVLIAHAIDLPEITVRPTFTHYKTKGNNNTDAGMFVQFSMGEQPNQNLGAEVGRKFNFNKTVHLERFRFYISGNSFESVKFRINIRRIKDGRPAELINTQNIITEVADKYRGWVNLDLSAYDLEVSEDIVVGVEWIEHSSKGGALNLPITIPSIGAVHYYHYGSQGEWKKFPMMSACMELEVGY